MALKLGNIDLSQLKLANLYNTYLGMTSRDQTVALIVVGIILVLVVALPVTVASGKIDRLKQDLAKSSTQLKDLERAIGRYQDAQTELRAKEQQLSGGFDSAVATTLEGLASKAGIADRIDSLKEKPSATSDIVDEVAVDVRIKKVSLSELVSYLQSIEQDPDKLLRLSMLDIKPRYDNKKELDVSFAVSTYRLLETTGGGE